MTQPSSHARNTISAIHAAQFPAAQIPELMLQLQNLFVAGDQIRAGIQCRHLNQQRYLDNGGSDIKIAVIGNFSCQAICDILRCQLLGRGLLPTFHVPDYNQYCFELLDADSPLYRFAPELVLCLLDEHCVLNEIAPDWRPQDFELALQQKLMQLTELAARFGTHSQGLLLLNTIPLSNTTLHQCLDYRGRSRISRLWAEFNAGLCALTERFSHVLTLDTQVLLSSTIGLRDPRFSFYAKAHMSDELLAAIANEVTTIALARAGKNKKCLVLDLDNTLWGGILGDDGIDGIELSNSARGEAFLAFQQTIRRLSQQGVLLAVSSKNEATNVKQVLLERNDMVLKEEDFAVIHANWEPKSQSITNIATLLNIGCDSLVFVDDSAFERSEVAAAHPQVGIIALGEEPAEHVAALLHIQYFSQLELHNEDYQRGQLYKTEARRQDLLKQSESVGNFLQSLILKLNLFTPMGRDLARISQLTLRTNQFNLTTQRMTETEVKHFLEQPDHSIIALQSEDKFGDYGLIGCLFYHLSDEVLFIDNVILSCRVFSRGLESAALNHLLHWAKQMGCKQVEASYIATAKNNNFADFYDIHGFIKFAQTGYAHHYHHDLREIGDLPSHLNLTATYQEQSTCTQN